MKLSVYVALILLAVLCAAPAMADRVIFAPTGTVLGGGEIKAEGAISPSNDDSKIYWAGIGLQRFEINAIRFENDSDLVGANDTNIVNAEFSVLPETTLTPGIGVGIWDVTDETNDGRGYFIALSKAVPLTSTLPSPISDVRVHAGLGLAGLDTLFAGAEAKIPLGLKLYAEYFQDDVNFAVGWGPIPALQVKAYLLDGDTYYGLQFNSPF